MKWKENLVSELETLKSECSHHNWDGYEASPISKIACFAMERFIFALPIDIPAYEVSVDPDGDPCLDWYKDDSIIFSVSINENASLAFYGKAKGAKIFGDDIIFIDEVPNAICDWVRRATK